MIASQNSNVGCSMDIWYNITSGDGAYRAPSTEPI